MHRVIGGKQKTLASNKNKNLYFCRISLLSKQYRQSITQYLFTPNLLFYEDSFNQTSLSSLKYVCIEYLYKPNGDFKNFI